MVEVVRDEDVVVLGPYLGFETDHIRANDLL